MAKILILGSGGREHALVWSLAQEQSHDLVCAPGNAGTANIATNIAVDVNDHNSLLKLVEKEGINLTVVGPEAPLAVGIVDRLQTEELRIFGPSQAAAQLESSKLFARDFMREVGIPHPDYRACRSKAKAQAAVRDMGLPIVLKADGLAAGKGVIICQTQADVDDALDLYFDQRAFGEAGLALSVEQCLSGPEMSVFALCDGESFVIIGTAQDYKRAYDGDLGPNTGGMGSIAPSPLATSEFVDEIAETVLKPAVDGMKARGCPYIGCLYAGLMIADGRPYVIEFNVRMGDPESQVVLPLLETPLSELVEQALSGGLPDSVNTKPGAAVCVVVASEGYPGEYEKGKPITGLERLDEDIIVYHAGTADRDGQLVSAGGRVLNVVGMGETIAAAAARVYENIPRIDFPGSFYRKDIGG
ncbi:MAG: phosphoribosylamine--glycine ligase [Fidelibacterota bacterium]|nr:MAG: phosphoribosylamine--glycine ligase [Candidatus Neomarinimicrobiota bacterium]